MAATQEAEFHIQPNFTSGLLTFLCSQLFVTPSYPTHSFKGHTIVVTGANVGLGLEAARHFFRQNAAKVILAVRNIPKGEAAREDILRSVRTRSDAEALEIWHLDQSSAESTLAFAERIRTQLPRIDAVVLNAGIHHENFETAEGYELTTQVNVLNTFLLALVLTPALAETRARFPDAQPHLSVVSSEAYRLETFEEINAPDLYQKLNQETDYSRQKRYQVTKLMEVLLVRELVRRLGETSVSWASPIPPVIINLVNPGLCTSTLSRGDKQQPLMARMLRGLLDRTTEVGARCYVHAAAAPATSHGKYQADGKNQDLDQWILTDVGKRVQEKVWEQTMRILEQRKPGILKEAGL